MKMERPDDVERIILVAVLRVLDCSQDMLASSLHLAKTRVGDVERWITNADLKDVEAVFEQHAVNRVVIRDLPAVEEVDPQVLVRAPLLTAEDILRHYRSNYRPVESRPRLEEISRLLSLWREQLVCPSLATLLQSYSDIAQNGLRQNAESETVRQHYFGAGLDHWRKVADPRPVLPIEQDPKFERIRVLLEADGTWRARQQWGEQWGTYLAAFGSWLGDTKEIEWGVAQAALESDAATVRQLRALIGAQKRDFRVSINLLTLVMACDLLVLGIKGRPAEASWVSEIEALRKLRIRVVDSSMPPLRSLLADGQETIALAKGILSSDVGNIRSRTEELLNSLAQVRATQIDICSRLDLIQQRLSESLSQ